VADDFLAGTAYLLLCWAWCETLRAAGRVADGGDTAFLAERREVALHGLRWRLPQAAVHWGRVGAGAPLARWPVA
jgi:hypothetical protein